MSDLVGILVFVALQALEIPLQRHPFVPHLDAIRSSANVSDDELPVVVRQRDVRVIRDEDVCVHPGMPCFARKKDDTRLRQRLVHRRSLSTNRLGDIEERLQAFFSNLLRMHVVKDRIAVGNFELRAGRYD